MPGKENTIRIKVKRHAGPGMFGWLFALCSLCLTLLLSVFVLFITAGVYQSLALERLETSLLRLEFYNSAPLRQAVLSPPAPLHWLAGPGVPSSAPESQYVADLIELLDRASRRDFAAAVGLIENLENASHVSRHAGTEGVNFTQLRAELLRGRELLVSAHNSLEAQRKSENSLRLLAAQFQALATESAELMGLTPESNPEQAFEFPVYSSGVLAQLPRCKGLGDNIQDLSALRLALDNIGGTVKVTGNNPHEIFNEKITAFRNATISLLGEREQHATSLKEIQNNRRSVDLEIRRITSGLNNRIRLEALKRLSPKINPYFKVLPDLILWISQKVFPSENILAGL